MDSEKMGKYIAKLRKQKNMTQKELADKMLRIKPSVNGSVEKVSPTSLIWRNLQKYSELRLLN